MYKLYLRRADKMACNNIKICAILKLIKSYLDIIWNVPYFLKYFTSNMVLCVSINVFFY